MTVEIVAILVGIVHAAVIVAWKHRRGLDEYPEPRLHVVEEEDPEPDELSPAELKAMGRWFSRSEAE